MICSIPWVAFALPASEIVLEHVATVLLVSLCFDIKQMIQFKEEKITAAMASKLKWMVQPFEFSKITENENFLIVAWHFPHSFQVVIMYPYQVNLIPSKVATPYAQKTLLSLSEWLHSRYKRKITETINMCVPSRSTVRCREVVDQLQPVKIIGLGSRKSALLLQLAQEDYK